jgi:hypothetical protein
MCIACFSVGVPICVIHGSCTSQIYQILQISALTAGPAIGGAIVWLKSFIKHETKKSV